MKHEDEQACIAATGVHPDVRCTQCKKLAWDIYKDSKMWSDVINPKGVINYTKSFYVPWHKSMNSTYEGSGYYCAGCYHQWKFDYMHRIVGDLILMHEKFSGKFLKECHDITKCHPNTVCKGCGLCAKFIMYNDKGNAVPFFFHITEGPFCEFCRRKKENEKLEELKIAITTYQDFVNLKRN